MREKHLPAVKPQAPRCGRIRIGILRERSVRVFEPPEEERVVRMVRTVDRDVPRKVSTQWESDVRQRALLHQEV